MAAALFRRCGASLRKDVAATTEAVVECVVWIDSRSQDGWTEPGDIDMQVATITTVGYRVGETPDLLALAQSIDAYTSQCSGFLFIPKVCVVSRHEVMRATAPPLDP